MGEEGREDEVLGHLYRLAIAATYRERLAGVDLHGFTQHFIEGATVETGSLVRRRTCCSQLGTVPGLARCSTRSVSARTTSHQARWPPRSSSCSKGCT